MPDGAAVIKYEGKRGTVWRIKFRDGAGVQTMETLGPARDGWTKRKAEAELRHRLADVDREGLRRAEPTTFETFAREWLASYPDSKALKRSTRGSYKTIVDNHLVPAFGALRLEAIDVRKLEDYVAAKRRADLAPRSINRQLNLLHAILEQARKRGLVRANAVKLVDRPREPRRHWRILSPVEVGRVERAFRELADEAAGEERRWIEQARVVFLTILGAGLRRGEVLGLRWRAVSLADPDGARLRVVETWVRDAVDTPKSEAGERTIALGPALAGELFEHRSRTRFQGDDERVFCHPETGGPLPHKRYAGTLKAALAKAKVEGPMRPFHDGRHSSITNSAAAGLSPAALMARAGHSDFGTTQAYIDLAGEAFRDEAEILERRLGLAPPGNRRRGRRRSSRNFR
jgi:integrase